MFRALLIAIIIVGTGFSITAQAMVEGCVEAWQPEKDCLIGEKGKASNQARYYLKEVNWDRLEAASAKLEKKQRAKNKQPANLLASAATRKRTKEILPEEKAPEKMVPEKISAKENLSEEADVKDNGQETVIVDSSTGLVTALDKVTVTATRSRKDAFSVPGSVTVVTKDDPKTAIASDYKTLLADVPGLEFQGSARRNGQVPVIRGFDADSILILKDGVRQNFQSQHDGQFFVDPELLKQVEVVRGPGSALYGSGSLGGVISFTTVDAVDLLKPGQTMGAKVSTGYQSVNEEFMTSAAAYAKAQEFDVLGNVVYRDSGDIKLGDGSTLQSEDEIKSGLIKMAWNFLPEHKLRLSYESFLNESKEPNNPQIPAAIQNNTLAAKDSVTDTIRIAYEHKDIKMQVYQTNTSVEEKQLERSTSNNVGDVLERELETTGVNIDNQYRFAMGEEDANVVSYGVEYYTNKQDGTDTGRTDGARGGVPDAEAEFYGGYVQDEITLVDGTLTITPGARFDSYSSENEDGGGAQDENAFSPKLALGYKPEPWLFLFGSYADAFRAPNLTELYASGTHFNVGPFQNNFIPNPDLLPEKSGNFEAGVGLTFNNVLKKADAWRLKISTYRIKAEDFIDSEITAPNLSPSCFLPGSLPPGVVCNGGNTQYINIPEASINGVDLEGGYEDENMIIGLGYTTMNGTNEETKEYITNIIPDTLKANLSFKFEEYHTVAGWRAQFVSAFDKVNSITAERDGYQVHDIYAEIRPEFRDFKNLTINFGVDNIFDEAYERIFAGSFEAGRNYKVKLGYKW